MNIRDLRYLVAAAEHRHFGRAAEACFVSQPTLSMQLKKLEQSLDVLFFERANRQVLLTSEGKAFVRQAKKILALVDEFKQMADIAKNPYQGEFRLGVIPTVAPYLLSHLIPHIKHDLPELSLYLTEEKTAYCIERLQDGKLDAAILSAPIGATGLFSQKLYDEPFLAALPRAHPLSQQESISLTDLKKQPLLLLDEGHCLREQALAICHANNIQERPDFRGTSLETLRYMVANGVGITLLPKLATGMPDTAELTVNKAFDKPHHREVILTRRESSTRQVVFDKLAGIIQATVEKLL